MISGDRVRQARELAGLTQADLADATGVTQAAIAQVEAGTSSASEELIRGISLATKFPATFFRQDPMCEFPMGSLLYRSHAKVSSRERTQAFRMAQLMFELFTQLADKVELPPVRAPRFREDPVTAAQLTRTTFGLSPDTPVRQLIHVLEKAGVWVLALPVSIEGLDAFSAWAGSDRQHPVIALLGNRMGDRLRFSIAHELGHLVLHYQLQGQIADFEENANRFASEFLLPECALRQELTPPVTLSSLALLRPRWRVSIQALAKRARDLNVISDRQYRYLFQQLSAKGWRKAEPGSSGIEVEQPVAFRKAIQAAFGNVSPEKIAAATQMPVKLLKSLLSPGNDAPTTPVMSNKGNIVPFGGSREKRS